MTFPTKNSNWIYTFPIDLILQNPLFPHPSSIFHLPSSHLSLPPLLVIAIHIAAHAVVVHVIL